MRRVLAMIVVLVGCGVTEPVAEEPVRITISVQGAVTSTADGSPIPAATVRVSRFTADGLRTAAETVTDDQGAYSFTFRATDCRANLIQMSVSAPAFLPTLVSAGVDELHIRCTETVQTIDVQLSPLG